MDQFLGKKYKLTTSENFEDYLKFIEVGFMSRKTVLALSPVACFTKNEDGSYTYTMSTAFRSVKSTFTLGEEFVEERADGVKVKSVMTLEGNTLTQIQIEDNGRQSKHVREFTPEAIIVTTTAEGWDGKSVRTYELVK